MIYQQVDRRSLSGAGIREGVGRAGFVDVLPPWASLEVAGGSMRVCDAEDAAHDFKEFG